MSTEKSPPESGNHSTPGSGRGGPLPEIGLVVRKQPPSHVFSEELFDVEFGLDLTRAVTSQPRTGDTDAEFIASLYHFKTGRPVVEEGVKLTVEPRSVWFSLRGSPPRRKQRVRCQIQVGNIRRDRAEAYCIRLSPRIEDSPLARELQPVTTTCINVVNHKIRLDLDQDWENIWYKDEGGRDKSLTVFASLHDKNDNIFKGEQIPLQITLFYAADGVPIKVSKQDILRHVGTGKLSIEQDTGQCTVRFRIEDVSKNHQGQDFQVEVAPDSKAKGFKAIAPGYTPAVSVRSKRNKRHRSQTSASRLDQRLGSPSRGRNMFDDQGESPFAHADLPRLREALNGVINWTEEVVSGLAAIRWQHLGYHQNPDGSPDYSRPYHTIPNPEAMVARVLGIYSETTRDQLMTIMHAIDRNAPAPNDPFAVMPPPIPRGDGDEGFPPNVPPRGVPRPPYGPGMQPSFPQEAFRDKQEAIPMNYPPQQHPMQSMRPLMHQQYMPHPVVRQGIAPQPPPHQLSPFGVRQENSREGDVSYVLAKNYKSLRTGERLGFPAYNTDKELLGFYHESNHKLGVGQFIPIGRHREDFGPLEIMQATEILQEAIDSKSEAVHDIKEWGSLANLLDHALVYAWSKDIGGNGSQHSGDDTPE